MSLSPQYVYAILPLRTVDGDTFVASVACGFYVYLETGIRLLGIDTPELHDPDPVKRARALEARTALGELLFPAGVPTSCVAQTVKPDKYQGRWNAAVYRQADGLNVAAELLRLGLAVPYDGGKRG